LLTKAREQAGTNKVWMKSAVLERYLKNYPEARSLLEEARKRYPTFDKLWMISGQIEEDMKDYQKAREYYQLGVRIFFFFFFFFFW